jgi:hypothetical protein
MHHRLQLHRDDFGLSATHSSNVVSATQNEAQTAHHLELL